ncbi:putative RNA polymerase, sigma-24 subunit, ECF subfamily [Verrucomicrobia bacterium]|nr:putative RNA polymerase, sigma-24 subunit, ECF subfamily [Verrucomicrobiota bacterium]
MLKPDFMPHKISGVNLGDDIGPGVPDSAKLFNTTQWSIVRRAKDDSVTALNDLFTRYREPLIKYLLGKSLTRDQAEDFVQGFCAHLLRRDFLAKVAQCKGKFRTFLLNSLNHYTSDQRDVDGAQKRGGGKRPGSLDETDADGEPLLSPASPASTADLEYDRAWGRAILDNSLHKLEQESAATGGAALYGLLEPVFHHDETSLAYREIAGRLEMTEGAVKVAAHRMRRRLGGLICEEIRQTVSNEAEFEEELAYFKSLFGTR